MEAIGVVLFILAVVFGRYWYGLKSHHRVWVAQSNGKKIQIIAKETTCTIMVDGDVVLKTPISSFMRLVTTGTGLRPRLSFRYNIEQECAAFGNAKLKLEADWYHSNKGPVVLYIGDARIPLTEIEDKSPEAIQEVQESLQKDVIVIQDPRWEGCNKILTRIRSSLGAEEQETIDQLVHQVSSRFLILEELGGENADMIWSDEEERNHMMAHINDEIEVCLGVVQKLHQHSIEKRQQALHEKGVDEIVSLLQKLEAEQEVEQVSSSTKKKIRQRLSQKR